MFNNKGINAGFMRGIGIIVVLFSQALISCNKKTELEPGPSEKLRSYITKSFNVRSKDDRRVLESYLTGDARKRLVAWSDEQFLNVFVDRKRKFVNLIFKEVKEVSPTEVNITYELSFQEQGTQHKATVTNKKMSYLVKESGRWMIRDVRSIRELIEYDNEMSLP